jgi:oligopeptide/dipeptide ABC transporter ATP-binding protein
VMFRGRVVERAPTDRIFADAQHPYTRALLDAVPVLNPRARRRRTFLTAEEIAARTPRLSGGALASTRLRDSGGPQLVEVSERHFVEAIVTG